MPEEPKVKILVIEDDPYISRACVRGLEDAQFDVCTAKSGIEALQRMHRDDECLPDLILLDLMLPIKSGFEVLEDLKTNDGFRNIPVIIFSNLGQESDISRAKQMGAVDYVVKSNTSMRELVEKVRENLVINRLGNKS